MTYWVQRLHRRIRRKAAWTFAVVLAAGGMLAGAGMFGGSGGVWAMEAGEMEVGEAETDETEVDETEADETETGENEADKTEVDETEADETKDGETESREEICLQQITINGKTPPAGAVYISDPEWIMRVEAVCTGDVEELFLRLVYGDEVSKEAVVRRPEEEPGEPEEEAKPPLTVSAGWKLAEGIGHVECGCRTEEGEVLLYTGDDFILDAEGPTVSAALRQTEEMTVVRFDITDENDTMMYDTVSVRYKEKAEEPFRELNSSCTTTDEASSPGKGHRVLAEFTSEGFYEVIGCFSDLAGNQTSCEPVVFRIDRTPPEVCSGRIRYTAEGEETRMISGNTHVSCVNMVILIPVKDDVSGLKQAEVYVKSEEGEESLVKVKEYSGEYEDILAVDLSTEGTYMVGVRLTDRNDHEMEDIYWSDPCMIDRTAPRISLFAGEAAGANGIYREDVPMTCEVTDNESKIETICVTVNGQVAWEDGNEESKQLSHRWNLHQEDEDGTMEVIAYAKDYAGNESVVQQVYELDQRAPILQLSMSDDESKNRGYYRTQRTLTVRIEDAHIDPEGIAVSSGGEILRPEGEYYESETVLVRTYRLTKDGTYAPVCTAVDLAGNESHDSTERFVIDTTVPEIRVTYSDAAGNAPYYRENRSARITCTDENMDWGETVLTMVLDGVDSDGRKYLKNHSTSEHGGEFTIDFSGEGTYRFRLTAMDMAGNVSDTWESEEFVIDKTLPELSLLNLRNGSSENGDVEPVVRIRDLHPDERGVELTVTRDSERIYLPFELLCEGEELRVEYSAFPYDRGMDGHYRIRTSVSDLAGNVTEGEWYYTVNRFGSSYEFGVGLLNMVSDYYTAAEEELIILEKNADPLEEQKLLLGMEDTVRFLNEGTDYTVTMHVDDEGWYHYRYVVHPNTYAEDGIYSLNVYSGDLAGNKTESAGEKVLIWYEDRTAPDVRISGIGKGSTVRSANARLTVEMSDAAGIREAVIGASGIMEETYDAQQILDAEGIFRLKFEGRKGRQRVYVKAVDPAGNETCIDDYSFRLTGGLPGIGRKDADEPSDADTADGSSVEGEAKSALPGILYAGGFFASLMIGAAGLHKVKIHKK